MPHGIPEGTPVREWPKELRKDSLDYLLARHWKVYSAIGVVLVLVGLTGSIVPIVNIATGSSGLSNDEFIELIASDPDNTYDREEAACIIELLDAADVGFRGSDRDEVMRNLGETIVQMSDVELERFDGCLDEESRARGVDALSDSQIRELYVELLVADPAAGFDRVAAECMVDVLDNLGVLREIATADTSNNPDLDAAFLQAETTCF